uniref:G-patch domain-containing protein n=1 Tax=Schizophyllum commune (strain H4-8 / FGSC 9210) TaxID=578458 RepID=D8PX46_SCHCM
MAGGSEFRGVRITYSMVLDTHEYLSSQGWSGHGNGLRHGAISRPIIIAQKKNNKGLGKERDDGFQFWNHVFDAAVKTINIKIADSDDESDDKSSNDTPALPAFNRTSTGILSNRAPILGGSAISSETSSGSSTPTTTNAPLSIFAQAKRETARRNLYGRFYRAFRSLLHLIPLPLPPPPPRIPPSRLPPPESRSKDKKEKKKQRKADASVALDPKEEKRRRKVEKRVKKEEKKRREKGKGREVDDEGVEGEESSADASDEKKDRKSRKRKDRSDSDSTGEAKPDTSGLNDAPTSAEPPKKRRKRDERDEATTADQEDKAARKERKRMKREAKAAAAASGEEKEKRTREKDKSSSR